MIDISGVFAVDGHDGAGKTTLARLLAPMVNGIYQRPFHGALGAALLSAAERGDFAGVIALGEEGIGNAVAAAGNVRPIILDRSWMTVATLVNWENFFPVWNLWIPTALCWADLETTLERLGQRDEKAETIDSHKYYLPLYLSIAERSSSKIIRTDLNSTSQCSDLLVHWIRISINPGSGL